MEYESGRPPKNEEGNRVTIWIIVAVILFLAGFSAAAFFFISSGKASSGIAGRIKGAVLFYVFSQSPDFYFLAVEKNGNDYILKKGDLFEVSYRDEFVVKKVSTDVLSGEGVSVDIPGIGDSNDLQKLLKGVDLVDRTVWSEKGGELKKGAGKSAIQVSYKGEIIASIPIKIMVTAQDWLRYADKSKKIKVKIEYTKKAMALNRADVDLRLTLASLYFDAGMTSEAIEQYKAVLRLRPNDGRALSELGKCYLKIKKYDEALEVASKSVKVNSRNEGVLVDLATAWSSLGNWEKAISAYREVLKIRPDDPAVLYRLGTAYEKTGNLDMAAKQYLRVLEKSPTADDVRLALADIFVKKKNFDGAIRLYGEVLKRQPKNAAVYANLGFAYGRKGKHTEEIANYQKAIRLKPGDPVVHFNLATVLEKMKRTDEAAKEYQKVLRLKADDYDAMARLADIRFAEKNYREATPLYEKLAAKKPTEDILHKLTTLYTDGKKYDKAIIILKRLINLHPQKGSYYSGAARVYGLKGDTEKQIEYYQLSLKHDPEDYDAYAQLGAAYEKKGLLKEALKAYTTAYQLNPDAEEIGRNIPRIKIMLMRRKQEYKWGQRPIICDNNRGNGGDRFLQAEETQRMI